MNVVMRVGLEGRSLSVHHSDQDSIKNYQLHKYTINILVHTYICFLNVLMLFKNL